MIFFIILSIDGQADKPASWRVRGVSSAVFKPTLRFLATLLVGGLGGMAAQALGMPGGWLFGALLLVGLLGFCRAPLDMPFLVRSIGMGYAGLVVGAAISSETLRSAALLPASLLGMLLLLAAVVWGSYLLHRHLWGASPPTAIASTWPGNILLAFSAGEALKADMGRVSVVQLARLIALVVVVPLAAGGVNAEASLGDVSLSGDLLLAGLITAVCVVIARRLAMVGGEMFLSAIAVGALTGAGLLQVAVPDLLTALFQVLVGAYVGLGLSRCSLAALRAAIRPALWSALLAALLTLAFALLFAWLLDYPAVAIALAYAPGGAEAMILLSAAFGVDAGFVGIHHTVRLIGLTLLFPLVLRLFVPPDHQATGRR